MGAGWRICGSVISIVSLHGVRGALTIHTPRREFSDMAKAQKRSNREIRKPKAVKSKSAAPAEISNSVPVNTLMRKPKGKL